MTHQSDDSLKSQALSFYSEDMERIELQLQTLLKKSKCNCALLIDMDGHLVAQAGATETFDTESISALVAGGVSATQAMAQILGEKGFGGQFYEGEKESLQLNTVGRRTILCVIFEDSKTTVGMVRLYGKEITRKLEEVFAVIEARDPADRPNLEGGYKEAADDKLNEFFG